jgi:pimeloyl-ACP methyl ester carboxylesterase
VWNPLLGVIANAGRGDWLCPDLPGHGGSAWRATYSVGELAAAVAPLLADDVPTFVIGHSLGVYIGLALASGWFSARIGGVLGIGPKVNWTDAEIQMMREFAARPARTYDAERDAIERYRKVSGLIGAQSSDAGLLARGTARTEQGFRLAQDPRTHSVVGASFASLVSSARCPVLLARGEHDSMVSLGELRAHCDAALDIPGAGHNAHVDDPAAVLALAARLRNEP